VAARVGEVEREPGLSHIGTGDRRMPDARRGVGVSARAGDSNGRRRTTARLGRDRGTVH
jgi:hypothetical protein